MMNRTIFQRFSLSMLTILSEFNSKLFECIFNNYLLKDDDLKNKGLKRAFKLHGL